MLRNLSGRTRTLSGLLVILVATGAIVLAAYASSTCQYKEGGCKFTVALTEYTGPPPIPFCLTGVPLVQVTVSGKCTGAPLNFTTVRCGILSDAVVVTAGNRTVTAQPVDGSNWEDAMGNCTSYLDVSVD